MKNQPIDKVVSARAGLILDHCFFGSLACHLQLDENEAESGGIAATDGVRLIFNPEWVKDAPRSHMLSMVAHEVLHNADGDFWRGEGRDRKRWQYATDHRINNMLTDCGFVIPSNWLCDRQYRGMSAERIYDLLPPDFDKDEDGDGQGQGQGKDKPGRGKPGGKPGKGKPRPCGGCIGPQPGSEAEALGQDAMKARWEEAVLQAEKTAKMMGNLPGGLERMLERIRKPFVDWKALLWRFFQDSAKADYRWTLPNRRFIGQGLYLPSLRSEQMPPIIFVFDTSASIDEEEANQFAAEVVAAAESCNPEEIIVIHCDAAVHNVERFLPGEPIKVHPVGGGGTDFRPAFKYVEKEGIEAACLVYLTDMYGTFPKTEPDYPVMWASTTFNAKAPFGEVVPIKDDR